MQIGRYTPGGQIAAEDVTGRHKSENGSDPLSRHRTLKAAVQRGHTPDLDIRSLATRLRSSLANRVLGPLDVFGQKAIIDKNSVRTMARCGERPRS